MSSANLIAVVTGANKGIGLEIARQLCAKQYKVYVGSRNQNKYFQYAFRVFVVVKYKSIKTKKCRKGHGRVEFGKCTFANNRFE